MSTLGKSVGIIGAGAAGLITAKTLLDDGFEVLVITRDASVGGVWCKDRVYPGLHLNKYVQFLCKDAVTHEHVL